MATLHESEPRSPSPLIAALPGDDVAVEHWRSSIGDGTVYSRRAPDRDDDNEDRAAWWCPTGGGLVLAVADGAGGHAAGGQAAELAIGAMSDALAAIPGGAATAAAAVLAGFDAANRRVLELRSGAATTLCVVLIEGGTVRTFHAGDSQALLVGQRGKLRLLTTAHSPVGYAVEAGVLDQGEAIHHDQRHLVSNLVGNADMHIEISAPIPMRPRDTVLVASDGVFDNLEVPEVVELVRSGPLAVAARRLAEQCQQRMEAPAAAEPSKLDDVTFVLFRPARRSGRGAGTGAR